MKLVFKVSAILFIATSMFSCKKKEVEVDEKKDDEVSVIQVDEGKFKGGVGTNWTTDSTSAILSNGSVDIIIYSPTGEKFELEVLPKVAKHTFEKGKSTNDYSIEYYNKDGYSTYETNSYNELDGDAYIEVTQINPDLGYISGKFKYSYNSYNYDTDSYDKVVLEGVFNKISYTAPYSERYPDSVYVKHNGTVVTAVGSSKTAAVENYNHIYVRATVKTASFYDNYDIQMYLPKDIKVGTYTFNDYTGSSSDKYPAFFYDTYSFFSSTGYDNYEISSSTLKVTEVDHSQNLIKGTFTVMGKQTDDSKSDAIQNFTEGYFAVTYTDY